MSHRIVVLLDNRAETLHSAEQNLESNAYIIDKSKRALRNMTWSGWLYNLVTPSPAEPGTLADATRSDGGGNRGTGASHASAPSASQQREDRASLGLGASAAAPQDEVMHHVSRSLDELHRIGVTMGEALEAQTD